MARKQMIKMLLELPLEEIVKQIRLDEEIAKKAISELNSLKDGDDPECAHRWADNILCRFIESLGYDNVTEAFYKVPKWYC